jgi:ABC-type sugar transport system ATPase subunit
MPALTLHELTKRYGDVEAVRGLSLEVEPGELLALIGPSGCGKTSTCKMIAGLEDITAGELQFAGKRVNELASEERNIAMVFEDYALYPRMNVFENVAFPLRVRKVARHEIRARVEEMLEKIELTDVRAARVQDLSGGQQQRVSIARALVREPTALIMDEPLSHLDVNLKGRLRSEIRILQQQLGLTGVLVTHDQAEAMAMADRVAVMHLGELRQCAAPHVVYDEPADMFVAGFIGEPPINLLPGALAARDGGLAFVADGIEVDLPGPLERAAGGEREVVAGIRPEHITVASDDGAAAGSGRVFFAEWFGSFQAVTLARGDSDEGWLTLLADAELEFPVGQSLSFSVDATRLSLFDPQTERNLLAEAPVNGAERSVSSL